jgi:LacI family transcriptional regulator
MRKQATIKDVALAAGVSVGSVSNVINGSQSVRSDTVARVKAAMAELGYRPNAAARSMRTRATRAVGFVVNDISNPIYAAIAKESEHLLNARGYHLILVDSDNRPGQEVEIFSAMNSGRVDALIATVSDERDSQIVEAIRNVDVPVVLLDREIDLQLDSVCIDYAQGIKKAVNYLADLGHQRIGLICGGENIRPGRECIKGFKTAVRKRGLALNEKLIRPGPLTAQFGHQQTIEMLEDSAKPTALICGGNRIFAGTLKAIKALDLKVPEQLSIIACDDTELTSLATPEFTVLSRDTKEIGLAIGELVIRALEGGKNRSPNSVVLGAELLVRESCARIKN